MNFLWKILLIAIVSLTTDISGVQLPAPPVAAAAVGGHVLDFDTIFNLGQFIPTSFRPKIYHPAGYLAVGPNNLKYVYFAIPQNGVIANVAFLKPINNTPPANIDYNIYFPADGSQPTTPDAVNYSLANIDNRENSPITEWYMKMFGVIPINHAAIAAGGAGAPAPIYVLAGWDENAMNTKKIIKFSDDFSLKQLLMQNFRQIASTSVGRVLLYRILIEIRRHRAGNNIGVEGGDVTSHIGPVRNKNRSIEIRQREPYGYFENSARINVVPTSGRTTIIGKKYNLYSYIATDPSSHDINIFHEMNHWYHQLRNSRRQSDEVEIDLSGYGGFELYRDYWGMIRGTNEEIKLSMTPWRARLETQIAGEEIRNILGKQRGSVTYLEGDDLSENLYRACLGKPLRFGHDRSAFYEDNRVIDIAISVTAANIIGYSIKMENPLYRTQKILDKGYRPPYNRKGLGNGYYK